MSNIKTFYRLGGMLGLNARDVDNILRRNVKDSEQPSLEVGPPPYPWGGFYGTISIKQFKNNKTKNI